MRQDKNVFCDSFRWDLPVSPFVILSWRVNQSGDFPGWGGLFIGVWYVTGAKDVMRLIERMS